MATFDELKKEYERIESKIKSDENKYAEEGKSFDEMLALTREDRVKLFSLSKDMRLVQEPVIQVKKKWKGKFIELNQFIDNVNDGTYKDSDGYGLYATLTAVSDIKIIPSDILAGKYRTDFSHVLWLG